MADSSVQYQNIAGVPVWKQDGNLAPEQTSTAPRALVIGTAGKGRGNRAYLVPSTTHAKSEFGTDGTLLRGMWEAKSGGAKEIALYRIGATPASCTGIGDTAGTAGYTITTIEQDEDAGSHYAISYDDSEDRLIVIRASDYLVVYDNNPSAPIDRGEVVVSGYRAVAGGPDVLGTVNSTSCLIKDIITGTFAGTSNIAGTDGLAPSRMKLYEDLYTAYESLKQLDFDVVLPMNIYLDDLNTVNQGNPKGAVAPEVPTGSTAGVTYPTAGSYRPGTDVDSLGMVHVEEYLGKYYFWWRFASSGVTADIYPSVGSANATTTIDGETLVDSDFHEVNFAYQLARFLYEYGTNVIDASGVISALPPNSDSLADKSIWLGSAPTWTLDTANNVYYIANSSDSGKGLLGNKFMAGMHGHRSGVYGGGFIATTGKFMDSGSEIKDNNGIPVDLGKYISVTADYPLLRNSYSSVAYPAAFAASYGGFYINMNPSSAPTNKRISNVSLVYKFGLRAIDDLAGTGYVMLRQKTTGIKIADAPTAALASSDWTRLSTCRIAKAVIDGVRNAIDPFLGEGTTDATKAQMKLAIDKILLAAKKAGYLRDYKDYEILQTPQMEVQGKAIVNLTLVPAFELRQVTLTISLSKSG